MTAIENSHGTVANLWDADDVCINFDEADLDLFMADDQDDDGLLSSMMLMDDDVMGVTTTHGETSLGLSSAQDSTDENMMEMDCELPSFPMGSKGEGNEQEEVAAKKSRRSSLVTPEPETESLEDQQQRESSLALDPEELARKCNEALRKLTKSMRQSDVSRSIVKRHLRNCPPRLCSSSSSSSSSSDEDEDNDSSKEASGENNKKPAQIDYFRSDRWREVERERRRLLVVLNSNRSPAA